MPVNHSDIPGLSAEQVIIARNTFGPNKLVFKKQDGFGARVRQMAKEPMMILLLVAAAIYFISGNTGDGIFMAAAIIFQASISLYQDSRSKNALEKLKDFSQPKCRVIRNGQVEEIKSEDLVVGDSLVVEEGSSVTADGIIIRSNDFSVNESILTGESFAVFKDRSKEDHFIYAGTTVTSGLAIATITAVGNETKLGKIGTTLEGISEESTPLELQIASFVKKMAITGVIVFFIVWGFNYAHSRNVLNSLLQSLTLAMSILPEEIPVAFTTFMALGAWRLMKMGIVVKQMKTVETLGSATVICTDKTGTLTENKMSLARVFSLPGQKISDAGGSLTTFEKELIRWAMWASEPIPFDPMEKALHQAYQDSCATDERAAYQLIHEYPLGGRLPMMTHIFENREGTRVIAAKGAPEALIAVSGLSEAEKKQVNEAVETLAADGFRVLAVGVAVFDGYDFPDKQQEFSFQYKGLVAFYDPPKKNIKKVLEDFYAAGIEVKIITGDNAATTMAIARQTGFRGYEKSITGDELMQLREEELPERVQNTNVFSRMFPEAKLKIINALKENHEVVAMTGDGVNDGPALKAAHIGIAMGKKGSELAKQAASLVLLEDDLSKMVNAVAMGRKIYANLKKAIRYIISIHIPIILTVFIPLALGWVYPNIFSPVHIIFLELIMGPTCSIIYENEPMEKNTMLQKPKPFTTTFFNWNELSVSILQGLVITAGTLFTYRYSVDHGYTEAMTRTMVFTVLIVANIFLTLINRSFYYSLFTTLKYRNKLVPMVILITITIMALLLFVPPLTRFFELATPGSSQLLFCAVTGLVSVAWYELVKLISRRKATAAKRLVV